MEGGKVTGREGITVEQEMRGFREEIDGKRRTTTC
jgi:hypothetical protein